MVKKAAPKKAKKSPKSGPEPQSQNTVGTVVPETSPNPVGAPTNPPVKPEVPAEKGFFQKVGAAAEKAAAKAGELLEKGEIGALNKAKAGVDSGIDWAVNATGGGWLSKGVGMVAKGANEVLFPTNVIDIVPGGKILSSGKKVVKAGTKVLEKVGKETAEKVVKEAPEKAAKAAAEKKAKDAAEEAAKKAETKDGARSKAKKKMKCGDAGSYGDLKKMTGEGKFDRDHIPSKAALKARATSLKGKQLTAAEEKAIDNAADAIAIPRQAHIDVSPTYGQSKADAAIDSKDLAGSAKRDVKAMENKIDTYDADGKCKKLYKKAAKDILKKTNADFDKFLIDILKPKKK